MCLFVLPCAPDSFDHDDDGLQPRPDPAGAAARGSHPQPGDEDGLCRFSGPTAALQPGTGGPDRDAGGGICLFFTTTFFIALFVYATENVFLLNCS